MWKDALLKLPGLEEDYGEVPGTPSSHLSDFRVGEAGRGSFRYTSLGPIHIARISGREQGGPWLESRIMAASGEDVTRCLSSFLVLSVPPSHSATHTYVNMHMATYTNIYHAYTLTMLGG